MATMRKTYKLKWNGHTLELGPRTCIMGILNVTPDSFSDGGKFLTTDAAVAHGEKLVKEGAGIIDIGGESTRPFSAPVPSEEQIQRVVPVIRELSRRITIPISIDTTDASVAEAALKEGASIINDVGAMRLDQGMADVAAKYGVPVILMHMKGTPENMQITPFYDDLLTEIKDFLLNVVHSAEARGIKRSNIIIDPGIGFGKTLEHNLQIVKDLDTFKDIDLPVLLGPSRKAFIKNILKNYFGDELFLKHSMIDAGTQPVIAASVLNGAHIVRVHDVAATAVTIKIIDEIMNCK